MLQHTDCGITRLGGHPELLATTFGIDEADLPAKAVSDPRAAVAADVAAIKDNPFLPANFIVSGLVYDVRRGSSRRSSHRRCCGERRGIAARGMVAAMPGLLGGARAPSALGSFLRSFTWGRVAGCGDDRPPGL